jgi:hypothetical protein
VRPWPSKPPLPGRGAFFGSATIAAAILDNCKYQNKIKKQQKSNKYETVMKNGNGLKAYNELTVGREKMNQ